MCKLCNNDECLWEEKLDLAKGYWQVHLSERAKKISAIITPFDSYEPKVMALGLKNATSTFQKLICKVLSGIDNCVVYLDDLVVFQRHGMST